MTALTAIAYVSTATRRLTEPELEALLTEARRRNAHHGVTGVLFYDDGSFFQYIEGPAEAIDLVYGQIRDSSRHHGIIELFRRPVDKRHFSAWNMGFSRMPESVLLSLAQTSWESIIAAQSAEPGQGAGVSLLLEYWSRAARRRP